MVRYWFATFTIGVFTAATALAQCHGKDAAAGDMTAKSASASASCCKDKSGATAAACSAADKARCGARCESLLAKAGIQFPQMTYRVGEQATPCPKAAAELARKNGGKIEYVVAEKAYADETEAQQAYAKVLNDFRTEVTRVKFAVGKECVSCPIAASAMAKKEGTQVKYRVAAFDFDSQEKAEAAVKAAAAAAEKVQMTMRVGEKTYQCPTTAADMAKKDGKSVEYCVGEKATACKVTAEVDLAFARLEAAVNAVAEAAKG